MSQQSVSNNHSVDIGEILRGSREAKGMSVASAAMHTNLRKDIIEKLENNQFGDIGAPVFTRGYLNIYARFLEVDEELVAREFSSVAQPRTDQTLRINSANVESQGKPYKRSMTRSWISLLLVLLIGGGLIAQLLDDDSWLLQQIRGTFDDSAPTVTETTDEPLSTENNVEQPELTVEVQDTQPQTDIPSLTSVEGLAVDNSTTVDTTDGLALSSLEENTAPATEAPVDTAATDDPAPVVNSAVGTATLQTSQENWIEIRGGDGKVISSQIYPAGSNIELTAENGPYRLNIGRPNAITLTVNGEDKSLTDYRNRGQTRLFNLSIPNE